MMTQVAFPILMYHRIEDSLYMEQAGLKLSGEHCPIEKFRSDLVHLREHYQVLPLGEIVFAIASGIPLPANAAAITFDDGTRDQVEMALPLLVAFGLPATFFVMSGPFLGWIPPTFKMQLITGGGVPLEEVAAVHFPATLDVLAPDFAEQYRQGVEVPPDRYISEAEPIRRMKYLVNYLMPVRTKDAVVGALFRGLFGADAEKDLCRKMFFSPADVARIVGFLGMDIGCHSCSHYNLATISDPVDVRREVVGAKQEIADATGVTPELFAYPAGGRQGYTPANVELVRQHYRAAFSTGTQRDLAMSAGPLFELPRMHEKFFPPAAQS